MAMHQGRRHGHQHTSPMMQFHGRLAPEELMRPASYNGFIRRFSRRSPLVLRLMLLAMVVFT
eukprot:scaffold484384_cov21-Prasinocladus_malaysianus.AAC.1